ncbi:MAG: extracellular solute-binding protein [Candidatus Omnitrophica bacterium]|nr:extracellular solute-binding protein [Candidatus Omnitrophota bacterium]
MKVKKFILALFVIFPIASYGAEKLVVISPHWEGVKIEIEKAFNQYYKKIKNKDIKIEWLDQGGTSDDLKYVESLFKKNSETTEIDVFFGGGLDPYLRLKEHGFLVRWKAPDAILKEIPEKCGGIPNYDKDYTWYGIVLSSFGILCNKKVLEFINAPIPRHWSDLAKPVYYGWVGASDPRHSGSMHMMFEIILQANGWDKGWEALIGILANTTSIPTSASQTAKDTAIGQAAVSLCIDSYALAQIEINGSENMCFVLPEKETVINPDCAGILKGAPNLENAKLFMEFLLSDQCQKLWMYPRGSPEGPKKYSLNRLSIKPRIYDQCPIPVVNPYKKNIDMHFDFNLASKRWALVNDLAGVLAIDCAGLLRKAYKNVFNGKCEGKIFFEIPVKEQQQQFLISNWKEPVFRNRHLSKYLSFSIKKYKRCVLIRKIDCLKIR